MPDRDSMDILTANDSDRWTAALDETGGYDFHHLPSYHRLAEMRGEGEAVMIVYHDSGCTILFPMLLRKIETPLESISADGYMDATSVYGYAGPLSSVNPVPGNARRRFTRHLQEFYESRNVVTAFTRLHPLFHQADLLEDYGEVTQAGVAVSVDLTRPLDEQYASYRKSHKYEIERLRKMGFTCAEVGRERLDDFVRIYTSAMLDVNAHESYFFDRDYFDYLMREMPEVIHLFVCTSEGDLACAALFATCRNIIQYHLAATVTQYRKLAPMKLLLDTARLWGNEIGATTLHLGGGVGAQRDRLYEFKMGFGGRELNYATWKHVINKEVYQTLCREARRTAGPNIDNGFFPVYRHPLLHSPQTPAT